MMLKRICLINLVRLNRDPYQIIIGSKSEENKFEFKETGLDSQLLGLEEIKSKLKK